MTTIITENNARALCGWKGREEINESVHAILHSKEQLKKRNNADMTRTIHDEKVIDGLRYWTNQIDHHCRILRNIETIYIKAYPKITDNKCVGKELFKSAIKKAKRHYENLQAKYDARDYYATEYQKAFNSGEPTEYWRDRIRIIDSEIENLEKKN